MIVKNKKDSVNKFTGLFSQKKGMEMTVGVIISIVLGLIVLVILIILIQQQVTKGGERYTEFGKEAEFAPDRCQSIIHGRFCSEPTKCTGQYIEKASPTGTWTDCKTPKSICCGKKAGSD